MSDFQSLSVNFMVFNFLMLSDGGRTAETLLNLSDLPEVCSLQTSRPKYTNLQFLKENVVSFTGPFYCEFIVWWTFGQLAEVIIQVSTSSKHRVARETLKINHFSVVTDEVVLALFCVVYKTIIHFGVGESTDI